MVYDQISAKHSHQFQLYFDGRQIYLPINIMLASHCEQVSMLKMTFSSNHCYKYSLTEQHVVFLYAAQYLSSEKLCTCMQPLECYSLSMFILHLNIYYFLIKVKLTDEPYFYIVAKMWMSSYQPSVQDIYLSKRFILSCHMLQRNCHPVHSLLLESVCVCVCVSNSLAVSLCLMCLGVLPAIACLYDLRAVCISVCLCHFGRRNFLKQCVLLIKSLETNFALLVHWRFEES